MPALKEIFFGELYNRLKPVPWGEELTPTTQKKLHLFIRIKPKSGKNARYMSPFAAKLASPV